MNRSILRPLIIVCAVAVILSYVDRATAAVRPHFSKGTAQFTGPSTFVGTGFATHLGLYTEEGSVSFAPTSNPDVLQVTGTTDYAAANGDVLHAGISGELNTVTGAVTATLTYDGGSGRFADATGSAQLTGQLFPDGSIIVTVVGTVNF